MSKTGLIVEGGGMKCAYGAGVLDKFLDDNITFDYCIGVSAGAANLASYLGGQRDRNLRFYTTHIHNPNYFGLQSFLKTRNLFGLQYIYGTLSNSDGADPIYFSSLLANPADYRIVSTNARTGRPVYFTKQDLKQDDYRAIMASCAIPAVCKPIEFNGDYYYDGGISDSIPVKKALDDGCEKLVAILSKPHNYVKKPEKHRAMYSLLCRNYPKAVEAMNNRHFMYTGEQKRLFALEEAGKAFVFAPFDPPESGTYTMDEKVNQQLYDMGCADYEARREELRKFLTSET